MGEVKQRRVRVALRVRPVAAREARQGAVSVVELRGGACRICDPIEAVASGLNNSASLDRVSPAWRRDFSLDECFGEASRQEDVFEAVGRPILQQAWTGFNSAVLAYGQTGAGKTFTMLGDVGHPVNSGLTPRVCCGLFEAVAAHPDEVRVEASYMEVYQETVRDLLMPTGAALRVREHPTLGSYVPALTSVLVRTHEEALAVLKVGVKTRATAPTRANAASSRSHAVFTLRITRLVQGPPARTRGWWSDHEPAAPGTTLTSQLRLVDLAGSERVAVTGSDGDRLKEARWINRSLATLCDVIAALAVNNVSTLDSPKQRRKQRRHVPYRNSALTWLLKESLGGNGFATMLCAISPCDMHHDESMATLKYAERARLVRRTAHANVTTATPSEAATEAAPEAAPRAPAASNKWPRLANLNPDPEFAGKRVLLLNEPCSLLVGSAGEASIRIRGEAPRVALLGAMRSSGDEKLVVVVCALSSSAEVHVDGRPVVDATVLQHGARLVFSRRHAFRYETHDEELSSDGLWGLAMSELSEEAAPVAWEAAVNEATALNEATPAAVGRSQEDDAEWLRDLLRGVRAEVAKLEPKLRHEVLQELKDDEPELLDGCANLPRSPDKQGGRERSPPDKREHGRGTTLLVEATLTTPPRGRPRESTPPVASLLPDASILPASSLSELRARVAAAQDDLDDLVSASAHLSSCSLAPTDFMTAD